MTISENVPLAPLTTFGVGGPARFFVEAATEGDVAEAVRWANGRGVALFVLGGGSNLLVRDEGFSGLVLHMAIRSVERSGDVFDVGAGEVWDSLVQTAVDLGYAGIECLAGIPGSVGGTPVQNVGAYGQEVSETVVSVRALDLRTGEFVELSNAACQFRYRESLFNTTERGRYLVTRVRFALRPGGAPTLRYADLQKRFAGQTAPALSEVAAAVREIRRAKGMVVVAGDPDTRSAGSFFKNPVMESAKLSQIAAAAGVSANDVPHWPAGENAIKLAAAWLLEKAGFTKGFGDGPVAISSRHTLALTNRGGATFADIERMEGEIVRVVGAKFGVSLTREPVVLG